jgi:hypothetical protein
MGRRGNGRLFAAAMTTAKRVKPERCRFGRGKDFQIGDLAVTVNPFHLIGFQP